MNPSTPPPPPGPSYFDRLKGMSKCCKALVALLLLILVTCGFLGCTKYSNLRRQKTHAVLARPAIPPPTASLESSPEEPPPSARSVPPDPHKVVSESRMASNTPTMNGNATSTFTINASSNGFVTHTGGKTIIANHVVIERERVPIAPIQRDSKFVQVNFGQESVTIAHGKIALIHPMGVKVQVIDGIPDSVRMLVDGMTVEEAVNTIVPEVITLHNHGDDVDIKLKWGD